MKTNLVTIDLETSGVDPFRNDVLSVGLAPVDASLPILEVFVKHDNIEWSDQAREYFSGFSKRWRREAIPPREAYKRIDAYLNATFDGQSITAVGHNIAFDLFFLRKLAHQAGETSFRTLSHRAVDTHSLLFVLAMQGRVPSSALSSDGAFEFYNIDIDRKLRHTALGDAMATRQLFKAVFGEFRWAPRES